MKCQKCGNEISESTSFCEACGRAVSAFPGDSPSSGGRKASGLAVASLILGILGVTAVFGLILGIVSLYQIGGDRGKGYGIAMAGTIISAIFCVFIPLLLIISIPVFERARESSRAAECLSNIRVVNLSILMYMAENEDRLPPMGGWNDAISPFVRNMDILLCPVDESGVSCSYVYNSAVPDILKDIPRPETTVMLFDGLGGWNEYGGREKAVLRHRGAMNVTYLDGHASILKSIPDMSVQ